MAILSVNGGHIDHLMRCSKAAWQGEESEFTPFKFPHLMVTRWTHLIKATSICYPRGSRLPIGVNTLWVRAPYNTRIRHQDIARASQRHQQDRTHKPMVATPEHIQAKRRRTRAEPARAEPDPAVLILDSLSMTTLRIDRPRSRLESR